MRKFNYVVLFVLALLCVCSCKNATYLNLEKQEAAFTKAGGVDTVRVECDGGWDVDDCAEWISCEANDSTLIITIAANATGESREDTIYVVAGDLKSAVAISQVGECSKIVPSDDAVAFPTAGGTQTIDIDTDGDKIKISAPSWVKCKYDNGKLVVTVKENTEKFVTGEIKLSCDRVTQVIFVSQQGAGCTTCGGTGLVRCPSCGGTGSVYVGYVSSPCPQCSSGNKRGGGQVVCPDCEGL